MSSPSYGDDFVPGFKPGTFGGRIGDRADDGQKSTRGIHPGADAFIFPRERTELLLVLIGVHVRGVRIAKGSEHAGDRAAHHFHIVYGLVHVLIVDDIPGFPERLKKLFYGLRGLRFTGRGRALQIGDGRDIGAVGCRTFEKKMVNQNPG